MRPRIRHPLLAGLGALSLVALSACSLADGVVGTDDEPEPVTLAVPSWPGGQANVAVVAYVLENELGIPVERVETDQQSAWDALGDGSVQAILEDWGAVPERRELHVERKEDVVDAGPLGITGHVGWFVPTAWAEEHPEVLDWRNLNEFADQLGGQVLHGDPEFATRDEAIIEDLGLDYRTVATGSEESLEEQIAEAGRDGRPLLTYLWQPHWLTGRVGLSEVELPSYYPRIQLRKYLNADFADEGGEAADFLRAFSWTAEDQDYVAELIAGEGMTPTAAAEEWVGGHQATVAAWLR
ncbi:glycine betaine ABC transporter substrate-binding protein [Streptomyces hoynatensis]|uniref:Glycine/betaine ABC transporter substrate-binding protein n=1 Tax=Streptomyces hoynatensis TaxID=1141874 RepID=A0A3A9ZEU6_9ACTN|nr:glycine betaine ABC transporter substrate-binding protein [Streptomyces hoynatensis]RKN46870.1 glycine/betaine ABC transporter substrate-binding protein [Streptomyces hoynatensis]